MPLRFGICCLNSALVKHQCISCGQRIEVELPDAFAADPFPCPACGVQNRVTAIGRAAGRVANPPARQSSVFKTVFSAWLSLAFINFCVLCGAVFLGWLLYRIFFRES
jgi:predicted RNA-binding Zn-ribbon protein involved in translation (DUF1610 family)